MTKAINSWAIPVLIYSFGVVKWSHTDLEEIDRLTRRMLTKFRALHPNSATERLYLPRSQGGRGLLNITNLCKGQIENLRHYFLNHSNDVIREIVTADVRATPLNLSGESQIGRKQLLHENMTRWKTKPLHGRYPGQVFEEGIDRRSSFDYLQKGYLHPETEGFIAAIQDKVVRTRNYERHILKTSVVDKCRKCGTPGETIEHVTGGCPLLANDLYLGRHNSVASIIHQRLACMNNLVDKTLPHYKYAPEPVLENNNVVLYWDRPIITDRHIQNHRPDILLIDKAKKTGLIIDIAVPLTHNLAKTENEKITKYLDLAVELRRMWKLTDIRTIPVVLSVEGVVTERFLKNLEEVDLPKGLLVPMQKAAILQTCRIVRKFLALG